MTLTILSKADYNQYEKNNTLRFALSSMMFVDYVHIVVIRMSPGKSPETLGGGRVSTILRRYGDLTVLRSSVTSEGILQIIVK